MGNLSKLFILFLSGNQLTGVIPNSFNDLQQLVVLDLSYNRLEGSLPASMVNLPNLGIIYLSNNKFTGIIPAFSVSNTRILNLQLHNNQFIFEDILPNLAINETVILNNNNGTIRDDSLRYDPQQKIGETASIPFVSENDYSINLNIDTSITSNVYTWYKDGNLPQTVNGSPILAINNASETDISLLDNYN